MNGFYWVNCIEHVERSKYNNQSKSILKYKNQGRRKSNQSAIYKNKYSHSTYPCHHFFQVTYSLVYKRMV